MPTKTTESTRTWHTLHQIIDFDSGAVQSVLLNQLSLEKQLHVNVVWVYHAISNNCFEHVIPLYNDNKQDIHDFLLNLLEHYELRDYNLLATTTAIITTITTTLIDK